VVLAESAGARLQNVMRNRGSAKLTYSIQWRDYPSGSRLRGAWRVRVLRAENLPSMDKTQLRATSDPRCEVTAHSDEADSVPSDGTGTFCFRQLTSVQPRNLDPEWDETFELPISSVSGALSTALDLAAPGLGAEPMDTILLPEDMSDWCISSCASCSGQTLAEDPAHINRCLQQWESRIRAGAEARRPSTRTSTRVSDSKAGSTLSESPRDEEDLTMRVTLESAIGAYVEARPPTAPRQSERSIILEGVSSRREERCSLLCTCKG